MSESIDEFSQTISGIIPRDEVVDFVQRIPVDRRPTDAEELMRELVEQKKLTEFQATLVNQGKAKALLLGDYVILDKLGSGGMGVVFRAQHRRMKRTVALKVLPPRLIENLDKVQRFALEVEAAARLTHPNVVTAYDARVTNNIYYLVMEYVDGENLSNLVKRRGPLPVESAVDYLLQAARGLEYAHDEGVIHRDIKPHNLLVDAKGVVKVLDMGLARLADFSARKASNADGEPRSTSSGTLHTSVIGTVDYMSPEQAQELEDADHRSDIYSLGCTLHYLLTGRAPYSGDSLMQKLVAHREHPIPSLCSGRADVSDALDGAFRRMLAKEPGDRYQSMSQVVWDFERLAAPTENRRGDTDQLPLDSTDVFVGRQPIYDANLDVVAYTLLFRDSNENRARIQFDDQATSQLLINAVMEIGMDALVGDKLAFVHLTPSYLASGNPIPTDLGRFALEIRDDDVLEEDFLDAMRKVAGERKEIAIAALPDSEQFESLVDLAQYGIVDIHNLAPDALAERVARLRQYPLKLIAEKVETPEEFDTCKQLGFDYFQGYFLCRPRVIHGQRLSEGRLTILQLLAKIQDPTVEFEELEVLIRQDVSLSFKILRYINSPFYGLGKTVESIHHALIMLGLEPIRNLLLLVKLSGFTDKPHDLIVKAMTRAKMCELLGAELRSDDKQAFFTVGLFSVLDALLDKPIDDIVGLLPLSKEVNNALVDYAGMLGQALHCIVAYEQGNWEEVHCPGLNTEQIKQAYLHSIAWAKEVDAQLRQ